MLHVDVRDNNVDQALRVLKKKMQREGLLREMRTKEFYEKPSVKKARQAKEGN
jgi:small subunit ribosomal protein S21